MPGGGTGGAPVPLPWLIDVTRSERRRLADLLGDSERYRASPGTTVLTSHASGKQSNNRDARQPAQQEHPEESDEG